MGKSCGWPLEMCLGEQYYDLGHPNVDMHKILEKMPLYTQFTQTLRDPCKILVHDIKNPFDYICSIDAQLLPIEWAVLYRKRKRGYI